MQMFFNRNIGKYIYFFSKSKYFWDFFSKKLFITLK